MDEDIELFLKKVSVAPPAHASAMLQRQSVANMPSVYTPAPPPYSSLPPSQEVTYIPSRPSLVQSSSAMSLGSPGGGDNMCDMTLIPGQNYPDRSSFALSANSSVLLTLQSNDPYFPTQQREITKSIQVGRKMDNLGDNDPLYILYETKVVSRKHAEFVFSNGELFLKDLGSNAGTFVNGTRLSQPQQMSNPQKVNAGDVIQFGTDYRDRNVKEQRAVVVSLIVTPGRPMGGTMNASSFANSNNRKSSLSSLDDLRPMSMVAGSQPISSIPAGYRASMASTGTGTMPRASAVGIPGGSMAIPQSSPPGTGRPGGAGAPQLANLTMIGGTIKR